MDRVFNVIKDLFFVLMIGFIGSVVGGLALLFAISSVYQSPIITLAFTGLFASFHLSDFRNFSRERRWLLFAMRCVFLAALTSFIVGFIRFMTGYGIIDWFFPYFLIITVPILFAMITTYVFLLFFFPKSGIFVGLDRRWKNFVEGGRIFGLWWGS